MIRTLALSMSLAVAVAAGQTPAASQAPQEAPKEAKKDEGKKKKEVFVLTGTVFTEQGFGLGDAQIKVRRAGEKKVRGKAVADRRGEFGVRLRDAGEYEVTVEAKGYETQARKFSAALGSGTNLVFRMQPASGGQP
jgi:hypothetical protein